MEKKSLFSVIILDGYKTRRTIFFQMELPWTKSQAPDLLRYVGK